MAKFRKMKRYARRAFGKARRYSKSNRESPIELGIYSAVYGAARTPISNMIPDVPQLGGYSDNLILGGIGFLAAKKGNGMIKKAGKVVLMNEAFLVGAKASSGLTGSSTSGNVYL